VKRFGEKLSLLIGLGFGMIGFAAFGWAPTGMLFCFGIPILSLWGLAGSPIQSLMSQRVRPTEQGQLQGANGSIRAIAELAAPFIFTGIYAYFIAPERPQPLPGSPFYLASLFVFINLILAYFVTRAIKHPVRRKAQSL
jgi:DHA1 family tetracycline resistance protein-like MFS transporter